MIENWFKPLSGQELPQLDNLPAHAIGRHEGLFKLAPEDKAKPVVALLGIGQEEANEVRRALYPLSFAFPGIRLLDMGNARRQTSSFLIHAIHELLQSGILPLIIGGDTSLTLVQAKAFLRLKSNISLVLASERSPLSPPDKNNSSYFLNPLLFGKYGHLFHFGLLGIQGHFTNPATFHFLEEKNFDVFRLGQARDDMEGLEPIVRDADLFSLYLSCLKESEAPEVEKPTPSGFTTEEACRLCRYAGMSDKLRSFGLYGYQARGGDQGRTARVAAQLIWYFLDGFSHRQHDFPASMDGLVEYIVDVRSANQQIVFWKSQRSGRWWMQVPLQVDDAEQRHRLIPCSYQDYQTATQDDLPIRLLRAIDRFS